MNVSSWHSTMTQLAGALERRHPKEERTIEEIRQAADEIRKLHPLAASCIDPGDGLRSPSTEGGSRSEGWHSDPTADTAANHVDREAGTLRLVSSYMADAEEALRLALSTVEDET